MPVFRLDENVKECILKVIQETIKGEIIALCVYGSQITGYAKQDSDYDIIIVLSKYKQKIRYKYIKREPYISALIVESKYLMKDAEEAFLGEFVAGRLLNAYEVIKGEEFFEEVERKLKSRIIFEILDDIVLTYQDMSTKFIIPKMYLLFEKLKQRAKLYPPALYSYVKTYTGKLKNENLDSTLKGFSSPLREMEKNGLILLNGETFKITEQYLKFRKNTKTKKLLTHTKRGLLSYLVHGYAGRVNLKVVKKELSSKIDRSKEMQYIPKEMECPKNLWNIDEGLLIVQSDNWLRKIIDYLGLDFNTIVTQRKECFYEVLQLYKLKDKNNEITIAVKKFKDPMFLKWAFLNLWALFTKKFDLSPLKRLKNEYAGIQRLKKIGLNTPEVISIILDEKILITKFIQGENLSKIIKNVLDEKTDDVFPIFTYGKNIGYLHKHGLSLGDTKPTNAIFSEDKIFFTDLEQSSENGEIAWDIAEFIYYSNKLNFNTIGAKKITRAFLTGYLKTGNIESIEKALNMKYLVPFQVALVPNVVKIIRNEMKKIIVK